MSEDPSTRDWREIMSKVHNHGPDEGPGLDCPEQRLVDGRLRGACIENPYRYTYPATDAGDVPAGTKFDIPMQGMQDHSFDHALHGILVELGTLMLKKHQDYGPLNIALAPGGAINGLRVRMHDKLARINNLFESGAEPNNESLEDSFLDLANYGIIGLMVLRGHWPVTEQ